MRLLLDTHTFLWFGLDAAELSATAHDLISDPDNERLLAAQSLLEAIPIVGIDALFDQYGVKRLW